MTLKIKALHPIFGAEVAGVDLASEMDDAVFSEIRDAFEEHSVLVFRNQKVNDDQQIAFSERFGPLERMLIGSQGAGTPIAYLSNVDRETGEIIEPDDKRMIRNACNMLWHSDSSFKQSSQGSSSRRVSDTALISPSSCCRESAIVLRF